MKTHLHLVDEQLAAPGQHEPPPRLLVLLELLGRLLHLVPKLRRELKPESFAFRILAANMKMIFILA